MIHRDSDITSNFEEALPTFEERHRLLPANIIVLHKKRLPEYQEENIDTAGHRPEKTLTGDNRVLSYTHTFS